MYLTINLAKNPITHEKNKHVEMRFYYFRGNVAKRMMNLEHRKNENQTAYIMMKGVQVGMFKYNELDGV